MIVYQVSRAGYYEGPTEADESPLEPGVYLMPARCVTRPPPYFNAQQILWWDESVQDWEVVDLPDPPVFNDPPTAVTVEDIKLECQRRIIVRVGAIDTISCLAKQLNNAVRRMDILSSSLQRTLTEAEVAELQDLQDLEMSIRTLRVASAPLELTLPQDYADDKYWI